MATTTAPAQHPFGIATIDSKPVPCLIRHWERGYAPSPQEWHARIIYAGANGPVETLVSAKQISKADGD